MTVEPVFAKARAAGRAVLVGYLPVGFPDVPGSIAAMRALVENGVDVVEIGVPYSDPVIDGPTISMSSSALQDIARKDPCLAANLTSSWNVGATTAATPGSGAGAGCGC